MENDTLQQIKNHILHLVNHHHVITYTKLIDELDDAFQAENDQIKFQALSEIIQANEIRRYEYFEPDRKERKSFYMPFGFRLM